MFEGEVDVVKFAEIAKNFREDFKLQLINNGRVDIVSHLAGKHLVFLQKKPVIEEIFDIVLSMRYPPQLLKFNEGENIIVGKMGWEVDKFRYQRKDNIFVLAVGLKNHENNFEGIGGQESLGFYWLWVYFSEHQYVDF